MKDLQSWSLLSRAFYDWAEHNCLLDMSFEIKTHEHQIETPNTRLLFAEAHNHCSKNSEDMFVFQTGIPRCLMNTMLYV